MGMVYAFYEPTLLDFIEQSLQQECRVHVPPELDSEWSLEFKVFRESLVAFLLKLHGTDFWEQLLKESKFSDEGSPEARDFLLSFMKVLVTGYSASLWNECASVCRRNDRLSQKIADFSEVCSFDQQKALQFLREGKYVVPTFYWSRFLSESNFSLSQLCGDLLKL